ncbi:hypothetical protein OC842_004969 [Tilletia horrida]|uniref:Uncharacterized protein n=1 Tax=Tilletia horrida TaxID=155126 RepID=A0AAN6G8U8_9BASI|nr:hypothetical protein OC842_004969 [Tilletia horrida]
MDASQGPSSGAGSTPPDALVRRVALKALALRIQQAGQDVDVEAIRQSAIKTVLAEEAEQDSLSAAVREEMRQVRALMESGIHAHPAGSSSGSSAQDLSAGPSASAPALSSHSRSSASPKCGRVDSVEGGRGTSANPADGSKEDLPSAAATTSVVPSAVDRFFRVAELVAELASRLEYDRIDLVVLSHTSKRIRAGVLPFLVRSVSVCFAKAGTLVTYFNDNPGLVRHVKYLRIWDDVAHYHANCGDPTDSMWRPRSSDAPQHDTTAWRGLIALLQLFERCSAPPPLIELSIGQFGLGNLKSHLQHFPAVIAGLASLRIVSDFSSARRGSLLGGLEPRIFRSHAQLLAEELVALIDLIYDTQDRVITPPFRQLSIFALPAVYTSGAFSAVLPTIQADALNRIAARIHSFSLRMHGMHDCDARALASILNARWPALHSMLLHVRRFCVDQNVALVNHSVRDFLHRHTQLEDVGIRMMEPYPNTNALTPEWHVETLPNARSIYLELDKHSAEDQNDFARRHPQLESLSSTLEASEVAYATAPAATTAMRQLRGDAETVLKFLAAGVPLRHVGVTCVRHSQATLDESATSITCCEHTACLA